MKKTGNVYVTDALMHSSLAIIRSLGKAGLSVTAGEETRCAPGLYSKYCRHRDIYPSPYDEPRLYLSYMLDELEINDYDLVLPVSAAALTPLLMHKKEFSGRTIIPYPDYSVFSKALDCIETLKTAKENGIPVPKTYYSGRFGDPDFENAAGKIEYPAAIRPASGPGNEYILCESMQEYAEKCMQADRQYGRFIIQEMLPRGGEISVHILFDTESRPVALTVQKNIRSYPPEGGSSTLRETVADEEAADLTINIFSAMKWTGLASAKYARDPRDGMLKLLSISPMVWGSMHLSILAGVDFPYLLYRLAAGDKIEPDLSYKTGIKCRWLLPGDLLWYLSAPGKLKNLRPFITSKNRDDLLSLDDPGPVFGFLAAAAKYLTEKDLPEPLKRL